MAGSIIDLDNEEDNSGFDPSASLEDPSLSSRNQTSTPTSSSSRGDTSVSLEHPSGSNRSDMTTPTSSSSCSLSGKGKSNAIPDDVQEVRTEMVESMRKYDGFIEELHGDIASREIDIDNADKRFLEIMGLGMKNLPPLIKRRLQNKMHTALLEAETEAQDRASSCPLIMAHSSPPHSSPNDSDSSQRTNDRVEDSSPNDRDSSQRTNDRVEDSSPNDRDSSQRTNDRVEDDESPQL